MGVWRGRGRRGLGIITEKRGELGRGKGEGEKRA